MWHTGMTAFWRWSMFLAASRALKGEANGLRVGPGREPRRSSPSGRSPGDAACLCPFLLDLDPAGCTQLFDACTLQGTHVAEDGLQSSHGDVAKLLSCRAKCGLRMTHEFQCLALSSAHGGGIRSYSTVKFHGRVSQLFSITKLENEASRCMSEYKERAQSTGQSDSHQKQRC